MLWGKKNGNAAQLLRLKVLVSSAPAGIQAALYPLTFPSGRKGAFVVDSHEGQDPLSTVCQIKGMVTFNTENNFTGHLLG